MQVKEIAVVLTAEMERELLHVLYTRREQYCDALAKASEKTQPTFLKRIAVIDALLDFVNSLPVQEAK